MQSTKNIKILGTRILKNVLKGEEGLKEMAIRYLKGGCGVK
jgi:hypothetical protein